MKKSISYEYLIINPENYRFDPVDNQSQAIELMLEEKGTEILNLAKDIVKNGLDQAKDIRVISIGNNQYLVLDGNRRITAIKCLNDTGLIKDESLRKRFEKISKSDRIPDEIQCFVYDSEKSAAKWIKLDHTGKNNGVGQDPWGSAEVDRFGYKFEGKISPAMQAVQEVENEMGVKFDTKKLKITTINRIFSNPEARSYLGIDIKNKNVLFTANKSEAIDRLNKLFSKVIRDDVPVADVYNSELVIAFIKSLFSEKPELTHEQGSLFSDLNDEEELKDKEKDPDANGSTSSGSTGSLAKKDWITDGEYRKYSGADKVKYLLKEMKSLDPKSYCNVLMPSIRVVLELALYHKLEAKGYIKKMDKAYKENIKEENKTRVAKGAAIIEAKKNWSPSFREMIKYISEESNNVISDPLLRSSLESILNNKENKNFIADLNEFIHNVHSVPSKDEPEKVWKKFGRILFSIIEKI